MRIYVHLFGPLRVVVSRDEIELTLSGESATVAQAMESLCVRYPQTRRYLRAPPGEWPPGVRALIAGERLDEMAALAATLRKDDHLTLLMPVAGG